MDFNNQNIAVYTCEFEAFVQKAKVQIKFPCSYFLQWKANNSKVIVSSQNRVQANKTDIPFNESLNMQVNILYDKLNNMYLKKESLLLINLVSKSRPDQIKLVGRVAVDLAEVLNNKSFDTLTTLQLQYCSVQASVSFCINSISVKQSSIHVSELDRSSFNQFMSFQANLKPHQTHRNDGSSTHRDFDDQKSARGSDKGEIRSLGRDRTKMSSPSLMKTMYNNHTSRIVKNDGIAVGNYHHLQQNNNSNSEIGRSSSIPPHHVQNVNQKFISKIVGSPIHVENNQSNFSFNQPKPDDSVNNNVNLKGKVSSSQILQNQTSNMTSVKGGRSQSFLPRQMGLTLANKSKDVKGNIQKNQSIQKPITAAREQRKSIAVISNPPKQHVQQQEPPKFTKDQQTISQRQLMIKKLQSQLQAKKQSIPLQLSFTSSNNNNKQTNSKRFSAEISKTTSQSKRIIGLTEALNQIQVKYTSLTLETEELRAAWKREKEGLLSAVSIAQGALSSKEREIKEKTKLNQMLQQSLQESERVAGERLAEVIYLKSQLTESQKQAQKITEENSLKEQSLKKLQDEIKTIQSQSTHNQDQINRNFGDRLALYQQKITELQNKLLLSQADKKALSQQINMLQSEKNNLSFTITSVKDQNKTYLGQIDQAHHDNIKLKEQNEVLRKQIERIHKENRQEKERIWSSKGEQVSYQLKAKDDQIARIKQQLQTKITHLHQSLQQQLSRLTQSQSFLKTKVQQLQNTIFSLSDQIANYQQQISSSRKQILVKSAKLEDIQNEQKRIMQENKMNQCGQEEVMLALNSQVEEQLAKIAQYQTEIKELASTLQQKDLQLLECHTQCQSLTQQLQLTKAQTTIYQSKLSQQHQHYQHQQQTLKLQHSQQVYSLQIQLQQLYQRFNQLQQIKLMLQDSLEQWQTKCTDDRIASVKAVGRLNELIKEKEETMYQMEDIMRGLEKQREEVVSRMISQTGEYNAVIQAYMGKQLQLRVDVDQQQTKFIELYRMVKEQRIKTKQQLTTKQQQIKSLQLDISQFTTPNTQLTQTLSSLKQSLQLSQLSLLELNSQSQQKLLSLKNQHNQQIDQYEQRIRELQQKITQKENQLLEREMILQEHEKEMTGLRGEILKRQEEIQLSKVNYMQINQLLETGNCQKETIIKENQSLKNSLEELTQKINNLQSTLIESQQISTARISQLLTEKQQLQNKIAYSNNLQQQHVETLKVVQQNFKIQLQQLKQQHSQNLSQAISQERLLQQQLINKIHSIEQQAVKHNQALLQKTTLTQTLTQQVFNLQQQLTSLKTQRQTVTLLQYKQQIEKQKQHIKSLNQQLLEVKRQAKQIPSLQRQLKIKIIQLNSLKYKSSVNSQSLTGGQTSNLISHSQQIIKLKNQEIEGLRKQLQNIKHQELQLYQLQTLNQQLYQSIQQLQEEKFNLGSQLNQKHIKIAELQQQVTHLTNNQSDLKQKTQFLTDKIKHYQTLILDFKGHQLSSTKSQSDRLNISRMSSGKVIDQEADCLNNTLPVNTNNSASNNNGNRMQVQTFVKKIKLLEGEVQKFRAKEEEFIAKEQSHLQQIKQLQDTISQLQQTIKFLEKSLQIASKKSQSTSPAKPIIQYRNPQQVSQTFKQIQSLLKKRQQLNNIQSTLLKLHQINTAQSINSQKYDYQTREKLLSTGAYISILNKEFQNLKTKVMKLQGKNYQQKAKIISLLKPCEDSLKQVAKLYQNNTESSKNNSLQNI